MPGEGAPHPGAKWCTLLAFGYSAAANAVMFMDFVTVSTLSAAAFKVDVGTINLTYSVGLLATLPGVLLVSEGLQRQSRLTFGGVGVLLNVVAAWLRWFALRSQSFGVCLASTVCLGLSYSVCMLGYGVLGERWFPPEQRALATSLAAQSTYFGWAVGAVLVPQLVRSEADLDPFLFKQALCVSAALPLFWLCHDERAARELPERSSTLVQGARVLSTNRGYVLQLAAFSLLGGVGLSVPAVQDAVLSATLGFSPDITSLMNVAFILSGVICGIVASIAPPRRLLPVLQVVFVLCALALLVAALLASAMGSDLLSKSHLAFVLGLCMAVAGGASVGFIGLALVESAAAAPEVPSVHSAGLVELAMNVFAGFLSLLAASRAGLWICAGTAGAASAVLYFVPALDLQTKAGKDGRYSTMEQ